MNKRTPEAARIVNIVVGAWVFVSAFIWLHMGPDLTNTWIVGLAIAVVAAIGLGVPQIRFINTALAIWLFISAFALPTVMSVTVWNNAVAAIVVFIASLVGDYGGMQIRRPARV